VHPKYAAFWQEQDRCLMPTEESGNLSDDDDDHNHYHVDGVRLLLWTAATNRLTDHLPGDIWVQRAMVEWYRQMKTPDSSTRSLWQSYLQIHLVSKQEDLAKEMNFVVRIISFILRRFFLTWRKINDVGPTALLPLRWKACYGFISHLKIHRPRPRFNPRTLGPMASKLTSRRRQLCAVWNVEYNPNLMSNDLTVQMLLIRDTQDKRLLLSCMLSFSSWNSASTVELFSTSEHRHAVCSSMRCVWYLSSEPK
jgi:hypothetical protein